jgi:hypothetical protein
VRGVPRGDLAHLRDRRLSSRLPLEFAAGFALEPLVDPGERLPRLVALLARKARILLGAAQLFDHAPPQAFGRVAEQVVHAVNSTHESSLGLDRTFGAA